MEDENTVWHVVLNQANTDKKKLHLYEQQSQYHPQKNQKRFLIFLSEKKNYSKSADL